MTIPTVLPFDPYLDLADWVGQRQATWRFVGIRKDRDDVELHPVRPARLTHDSAATIPRQLDVEFAEADTAALNTITDRVQLYMRVRGVDWPLGTYLFAADTKLLSYAKGPRSSDVLMDQGIVVDQKIDVSFAPPPGTLVDAALYSLLLPLGIETLIEPTPLATVGTWPIGTRRGRITEDLALDGDYYSPWHDHNNVYRFVRRFDPSTRIPDFDFDAGNKVMRNSIPQTDDLLEAPNRFVVISNAVEANTGPIVGRYDIPDSAPHSIVQRGFVIPEVVERQLQSVAEAEAVAANLGQRQQIFQTTTLDTAPDPRHDGYQVIRWQGVNWLEVGWQMECREGAPMRHVLRRAWLPN